MRGLSRLQVWLLDCRPVPRLAPPPTSLFALVAAALLVGGCGSGGSGPATPTASASATRSTSAATTTRSAAPTTLTATPGPPLPAPRSGIAATALPDGGVLVAGGLDPATVSTTTIFRLSPAGAWTAAGTLPEPAHDAAAATVGSQALLFGGGRSEGSDRIEQLAPGAPRVIGHLPQALSDLTATPLGGGVLVAGGWNGSATNRIILALRGTGTTPVGTLPVGVRYPAVAALAGRLVIAGGETTSGAPTAAVWSFDPATQQLAALPPLPAPADHGAAAALNGRFYLIGGLRRGTLSATILSWAPGETRWRRSGRLPEPLQNEGATPYANGIAVVGGRTAGGATAAVTLLRPAG